MSSEQERIVTAGEPRNVVLGDAVIDESPVEGGGCYLAYGPNMLLRQMEERAPGFRPIERVRIKGRRLAFGSNGVATLVRNRNKTAVGVVYEMTQADFRKMDSAEGVTQMKKYRRWRVGVNGYEGRPVFVYLLSAGPDRGARPTSDFLERIVTGMNEWGFEAEAAELRKQVQVPLSGNVAIREVAGKKQLVRIGVYVDPRDRKRASAAKAFAAWLGRRFRRHAPPVKVWSSGREGDFGDVIPERMVGHVLIEGVGGAPVYDFLRRWHKADTDSWGDVKRGGEYLAATLDGIYRLIPDVIVSGDGKERSVVKDTREIIPERIKNARKMRGLNQQELAKKCGFAPTMLSHIERGMRLPRVDKVGALAVALDVSADYLLGLSESTAPPKPGIDDVYSQLSSDRQEIAKKLIEALKK